VTSTLRFSSSFYSFQLARRGQGEAIEYLRAVNRVLRSRLGPKRLRFTDAERRLPAEKGKPRPNATGRARVARGTRQRHAS
jgi:hypothetical protein